MDLRVTTLVATKPIIRAKLNEVSKKRYRTGVLGVFAEARWNDGSLMHEGKPVSVVACPSVLAMWEALHSRSDDGWTVLLTPVDEGDLGSSILAHLVDGRLFTPNPWDALVSNFSATTIEPALYRVPNDRVFAEKLLVVLDDDAYTPAPGGVLTRDHVMSALLYSTLAISDSLATEIDGLAIMEWSHRGDAQRRWNDLDGVGRDLSEPLSRWLGDRSGGLGGTVTALLSKSAITDLIPLGLVADLFDAEDSATGVGKGVFLGRYGLQGLNDHDLARWARQTSSLVTSSLFEPNEQQAVIARAAAIVSDLGIEMLSRSSSLLKQGLDVRIANLCDALEAALPGSHVEPHRPCVAPTHLATVESAAGEMAAHFLARGNQSCSALEASAKLVRWLAQSAIATPDLQAASNLHLRHDSWVDAALIDARRGSDSASVTATLRSVIDVVTALRRQSDRVFAEFLSMSPQPAHLTVETVLPEIVLPLAQSVPTLLLVIDALAVSAANDVIADAAADGWTEFGARSGDSERQTALAALPTLTHRSRCSLLSADLIEGDAAKERRNFVEVLRLNNLQPPPGIPDPIFHKQALDTMTAGASLATDVSNAILDTSRQPLVAAVLNYVDDTLHHTDPGGTDWTIETIAHLRALLHAAKQAGRAVVITSDHGHVIDHGDGIKLTRSASYGLRAHGDLGAADSDYEIVVQGPRVMTDSRKAVLAVDDRVRYGQRSAGYHGGGTPAEVIVPVYAMIAGIVPAGYAAVGLVEPAWWTAPVPALPQPAVISRPKSRPKRLTADDEPGLFDAPENSQVSDRTSDLAVRVVASKIFANQMSVAGRIVVTKEQIRELLNSLIAAPARELTSQQAAASMGVPATRVNGALMQVKRVLDVEGYEVLEVTGGVVVLREATLREQFGIAG